MAATLPGRDGSSKVGERRITFAWFDIHREDLLRRTGCLTADGKIVGTLGRGTITTDVRAELLGLTPKTWPATWIEAVTAGVGASDILSGAPIAEFQPTRLARGPFAIIGDAAHVVSPMTGRGFLTGVEDAAHLARALATRNVDEPISVAWKQYEAARLPFVRALVAHSRRISADYCQFALANGSDNA